MSKPGNIRHLAMTAVVAMAALVIAAAGTPLAAQGNSNRRSGWANRMLDYKHELIVEKTGMSQAQEQRFMPLYKEMENKIYAANSEARALARKVEATARPTDEQYAKAAEALSQARLKEGQIEAAYFDKFAQILTKKQLFLLKQAELNFTRKMLARGKDGVKKR